MPKKKFTLPVGHVADQEFDMVDERRLNLHPRNVRHSDLGEIIQSIQEHGFYGCCTVQRSTCNVIAGNHRLEAARHLGIETIPVAWLDVDDETALRMMLVDNATSDKATNDKSALASLLSELAVSDKALIGTGYDGDELDALIAELAGDGYKADENQDAKTSGSKVVECPACGKSFTL